MIYIPHSPLSDKLTLLPAPANLIPEITRSLNTAGSLILLKYVELSSLHKQTSLFPYGAVEATCKKPWQNFVLD